MSFTAPPELITGLTDLLNFFFSLGFYLFLRRDKSPRARAWRLTMLLLTVSNLAGGIVHTVAFSELFDRIAWIFLSLLLCLTVAMFALCAEYERKKPNPKKACRFFVGSAVLAFAAMMAASLFWDGYIKIYVYYAAAVLVYALVLFTILAFRDNKTLSWYAAALFIQIPGGIVQARRTFVATVLWPIDYNTVYHLLLMLATVLLFIGYVRAEKKERQMK